MSFSPLPSVSLFFSLVSLHVLLPQTWLPLRNPTGVGPGGYIKLRFGRVRLTKEDPQGASFTPPPARTIHRLDWERAIRPAQYERDVAIEWKADPKHLV